MPVDPVNLYAYWNLESSEPETPLNENNKPLSLRIYSLPELSESPSNLKLSFDVAVQGLRNQKKVHLPVSASAYTASIGIINPDNSFNILATSEAIHVPRENSAPEITLQDNEKIESTEQVQNNNALTAKTSEVTVPDHILSNQENVFVNHPLPDNSFTNDQTQVKDQERYINTVTTKEITQIWHEKMVFTNFNDFGYDLKIYATGPNLESKISLSGQTINVQMTPAKHKNTAKSASGSGRQSNAYE